MSAPRVEALAAALARHGAGEARVAFVLGSGLGAFAQRLEGATAVPYEELDEMPASTVPGHAGRLVVGELAGVRVCAFAGRVHRYEGRSVEEVTRGVRALARLGVPALVLTNASGGIVDTWTPPLLMRVTDHVDLQSTRLSFPEKGLHSAPTCASIHGELQVETRAHRRETRRADDAKPRSRDSSAARQHDDQHGSPYDPRIGRAIELAAREAGIPLFHGIYAGLLGPTYETPAEVRMLRWMGADAVGMSTVAEAAAAASAGMRVGAVSCVTNAAAGLATGPLNHDEVVEAGERTAAAFCALLEAAVGPLAAAAEAG